MKIIVPESRLVKVETTRALDQYYGERIQLPIDVYEAVIKREMVQELALALAQKITWVKATNPAHPGVTQIRGDVTILLDKGEPLQYIFDRPPSGR